MIKAIIFDKDGVLIDSEGLNILAAKKAFHKLGINIKDGEKREILGKHPDDFKNYFLKKYQFSYDEFRKIQRETYHKLEAKLKPNKKIINLIKKLHKQKVTLALVTSAGLNATLRTLEQVKLKNVFDIMVTLEDTKERKPNPAPYLKALEKLNRINEECIVVEDSPVGIESAKKAGIKVIAFKTPYLTNKELSKADFISDSEQEIADYLRKFGVKI